MNPTYDIWVSRRENPSMQVHTEYAQMSDTYRMYRDVYDKVYELYNLLILKTMFHIKISRLFSVF